MCTSLSLTTTEVLEEAEGSPLRAQGETAPSSAMPSSRRRS
jgi:hypothetical protein